MHGQRFEDAVDNLTLTCRCVPSGLFELAEQGADLLVLFLEQHDGIGGHGPSS
jgi:hypothetical protein